MKKYHVLKKQRFDNIFFIVYCKTRNVGGY